MELLAASVTMLAAGIALSSAAIAQLPLADDIAASAAPGEEAQAGFAPAASTAGDALFTTGRPPTTHRRCTP